MELVEESPYRFRIDRRDPMRVPGVVFASRELIPHLDEDRWPQQVANVATLPGIVGASYAMPDVHWGYGFPIGGVAATDVAAGGVVSPGGVGFDISCGVRLLAADLDRTDLPRVRDALMDGLDAAIPRGMGRGAVWQLADRAELDAVLRGGSRYAVERGHGVPRDLARCEDAGVVDDADPGQVSDRAVQRGEPAQGGGPHGGGRAARPGEPEHLPTDQVDEAGQPGGEAAAQHRHRRVEQLAQADHGFGEGRTRRSDRVVGPRPVLR
ncbi:RtcB family protein, partial [Micromonospora sp. DH15]|nr:RtcB family protein [Micromonospora sp. DH15]